jgi:hypothetical protein
MSSREFLPIEPSSNELQGLTKRNQQVIVRLDNELPLESAEWKVLNCHLSRLIEFAPRHLVDEITYAISSVVDEQTFKAYMLGQEDLVSELKKWAA